MRKINFSENVNRVFTEEKPYSSYQKLMYEAATDKLQNGITQEQASAKIRQMFRDILHVSEDVSRKDLRRAIRRYKTDLFEVTEDTIEQLLVSGWQENEFFNAFVEIKSADLGDTNEFWVEDDVILTVAEVSGNHHDLTRQKLGSGESFSVKLGYYGVKIYTDFELFVAGRIDWDVFIQKVYEAFDKKVNDIIYSAVMASGDKIVPTDQFCKTGALTADTKDTFITLLEDVEMANDGEIVIMGTKSGLSKLSNLTDITWVSNEMKNERHTTGKLGLFEGVTLVEIPQRFANNDTSKKLVDSTKLLIMPLKDNKFVKLFNEGDPQIAEVNDGTTKNDSTMEYEYQAKMGVATVIGRKFGMWTIV